MKKSLVVFQLLVVFGAARCLLAQDVRHLTHAEASRMAIAKPQPAYPAMAKQLRVEGKVEVEASISEDGSVEAVHPLAGNLLLSNAAVEATKHWRFNPITQDGKIVKAIATIDFVFKM